MRKSWLDTAWFLQFAVTISGTPGLELGLASTVPHHLHFTRGCTHCHPYSIYSGLTKYCVDSWHNHYVVLTTAQNDHVPRIDHNQPIAMQADCAVHNVRISARSRVRFRIRDPLYA